MYCHKCGRELPERALFCPACGARSVTAEHESPSAASAVSAATSSPTTPSPSGQPPVPAGAPGPKASSKKKVILGVISALVVVVAVAAVLMALNWNSVDYVASVKAFQPFNVHDLPYTYGEVLDKYIEGAEWKATKEEKDSGLLATVEVSGTAKGLEQECQVSIQVSPNPEDPEGALFRPQSATVGDVEVSGDSETAQFLYSWFLAYGMQVDDLSMVLSSDPVELTQTFEDEASGITFSYPENWMQVEPDGEFDIVSLIDSANNASSIASLEIRMALDTNPFGIFTDDDSSIEEAVNEYHTFVSLEDTTLGDVPAVELIYQTEGLKGTDQVINYWYERGDKVYQVVCSYSELTALKYEPIFENIMGTYQIAPLPEPTPTPTPAPTPTPEPVQDSTTLAMEAYRDIVSQAASYDFSMGHGEPNPPDAAYSYALAPMCPGSDIPGLLLSCTDAAFGLSYTRIFQYDERSGSVWQPYAVMTTGVATAGGYRGSLCLMADGLGLHYYYGDAMTGEAYVECVTIEDELVYYSTQWSGLLGDGTSPTYLQGSEITWYDTSDTTGLQG